MNILVISDIHADAAALRTALGSFPNADLLLLCGDYLNHGPRNPLPDGWNPPETAALLNGLAEKIVCVRGNCDSEVDEMMLSFPCLAPYTNVLLAPEKTPAPRPTRIFAHHGHLYDRKKLSSWLGKGTVVVSGHTHVTVLEEENGLVFFNPGSLSLPKCADGKTCGIITADGGGVSKITLCSIEGKTLRSLEL